MQKVVAAIIHYKEKVLLTMREDFEFWCLPGGYVEGDESLEEAVHREVAEEAGLNLEINQRILHIVKPNWRGGVTMDIFRTEIHHDIVYTISPEVKDIGLFDPKHLPYPILREHADYIKLATDTTTASIINSIQSPEELELPKDRIQNLILFSEMGKSEWYASLFKEPIYI